MTVCFLSLLKANSQTVYYPVGCSDLLQASAQDLAELLGRSVKGSKFETKPYATDPGHGIILEYSSVPAKNIDCRVRAENGSLRFSAAQDNGLHNGIYQYLHSLGFRFYQPGGIWEVIPDLASFYQPIDTVYTTRFTYKGWFITGGYNRWAMDNDSQFPWELYGGKNGHEWGLYQRRNGMFGSHGFAGHRGDIMTPAYLDILKDNPCYTACFDGERSVTVQSVPDIHNDAAIQLWSNAILQKYAGYEKTIFSNPLLFKNLYNNYQFNHAYIGLEVPDGAHWANSIDGIGCSPGQLISGSDQHFTLANKSAARIAPAYPVKRFQVYAYDGHANVPTMSINPAIDVQVVATAFQLETSPGALLNRWYSKTNNVSEYQYMNLSQWSGETPSFYLDDLEKTVQRLRNKNSQGITWEASPAKFASLPFLRAANESLSSGISIDSSLRDFCRAMFGTASATIYELLTLWSNDNTVTLSYWVYDNMYKIPLYLQLLEKADAETAAATPIVKARLQELKAYVHYMILYYDWAHDQRGAPAKSIKAGKLCNYLARTNKMQLVNSYFMIQLITANYNKADSIYSKYNVTNGTAYLNGLLPLITGGEIEADYQSDLATFAGTVTQFKFNDAGSNREKMKASNILPLEEISLRLLYTNGKDYSSRSEFHIEAPSAGSFSIRYAPEFVEDRGYINFSVERMDGVLNIIKDFTIDGSATAGNLDIRLPASGRYKLTITTKYKSTVDLVIRTGGNYLYKNGGFLGTGVENYRSDLLSFPGYFYVPAGMSKVFFSINNSNAPGKGFATASEISKAFLFRDQNGKPLEPQLVSSSDSALFYLEVPPGSDGQYWQAFKMELYRLSFANISNQLWYARREPCAAAKITTSVTMQAGECLTFFTSGSAAGISDWTLYDNGTSWQLNERQSVQLPSNFSPNAIITLRTGESCVITKRLGDDPIYLAKLADCASGGALPQPASPDSTVKVFPNPGTGLFNITYVGKQAIAESITILSANGAVAGQYTNSSTFDISQVPSGLYLYRVVIKGKPTQGKLVKR